MHYGLQAHLHASSFLYRPDQGLLLERLLRGHRADDNVHLPYCLEQALVILQRPLNHIEPKPYSYSGFNRSGRLTRGAAHLPRPAWRRRLRAAAARGSPGGRGGGAGRARRWGGQRRGWPARGCRRGGRWRPPPGPGSSSPPRPPTSPPCTPIGNGWQSDGSLDWMGSCSLACDQAIHDQIRSRTVGSTPLADRTAWSEV